MTKSELRLGDFRFTHPDRVLEPVSGMTKADLARYLVSIAPHMLPFVAKRPLMLVRCPEGTAKGKGDAWNQRRKSNGGVRPAGGCFVQKHSGQGLGPGLERRDLSDGEETLFATKVEHLVQLAQYSVVEVHGWGSRWPKVEAPDWIVFDLDPDTTLPFRRVADAALELHDELTSLGLDSWVKTTGGKGLHVVVPLSPRDEWPVIRAFSRAVAEGMAVRDRKRYVATMTKARRHGKIFVDYFRNGRGATAVLPYSTRAREGATVAMPISWEEVATVDPRAFDVFTVPKILASGAWRDPWSDLLDCKQKLPRRFVSALAKAS